jgi:hypothetical protein
LEVVETIVINIKYYVTIVGVALIFEHKYRNGLGLAGYVMITQEALQLSASCVFVFGLVIGLMPPALDPGRQ